MSKQRVSIPKMTKETVLKEFNYRCAICGADKPHIHHIDENPSNNDISNLIPLCPNHHLADQHNPTSSIPYHKMKLFRDYKDPTILNSKFDPLFVRLLFLFEIEDNIEDKILIDSSNELVGFISFLKMGEFYSKEIKKLIQSKARVYVGPPFRDYAKEYKELLINNRKKTIDLIVELLRYQDWIDN